MMRRNKLILLAVLLVMPIVSGAGELEATKQVMAEITQSLRQLLPFTVAEKQFADPDVRPTVSKALVTLAQHTEVLTEHVATASVGTQFLSKALARYSATALRDYEAGYYQGVQYRIRRLTSFCIACHSRLPSAADSSLAEDLVTTSTLAGVTPLQRANLQVATRQFDAALTTFEHIFIDSSVHPADIVNGPLIDYLIICLRVKQDGYRPITTLRSLLNRADLPMVWQENANFWINSLHRWHDEINQPATLARGRQLIEVATKPPTYAMDRRPLIQYLIASSLLNRFIATRQGAGEAKAVAESYYLLGLAEYRIGRDYWVLQGEHFLERAIRLAPHSTFARSAYELLEEETIVGYTGSAGIQIPVEVQQHLDELKHLLQ